MVVSAVRCKQTNTYLGLRDIEVSCLLLFTRVQGYFPKINDISFCFVKDEKCSARFEP